MVLSIISALFCIPLILIASIGLGLYYHDWPSVMAFFYAVQIFIAVVQLVVAIVTSAYSCRVVCCGKKQMTTNPIIRPPSPHFSAPTYPSSVEGNTGK